MDSMSDSIVSFECMPEDIIEYIFMHLSPYGDLQNCRMVSRCCKRLAEGALSRMRKALLRCSAFDWFLLMQQPDPPTKSYNSMVTERCSHSACYQNGSIFVFGGCAAAYTTFNDLWRFDLARRIWSRPMPSGTYPTPKACATLVDYKNTLLLFGGWSKSSPNPIHQITMFYNELHCYDVRLNTWTQMNSDGQAPHLAGHSTSVVNDCMIVFGGSYGSGSSNTVYVYEIKNQRWYSPETSSPKPAPRYGQSQVLVDDRHLLIFGGCGGPNLIINDVWLLTINVGAEWLWEELAVLNPHLSAPQLWSHPACKVGTKAVVLSKSPQRANGSGTQWRIGTSYRSMSMSPRLSTGDVGRRPQTLTNRSVPPQGNLIPPRQRKLISSRSLDEHNGSGTSSCCGGSNSVGGTSGSLTGGGVATLSAGGSAPPAHNAELQRARSIPAIIVGEIPRLVVTEETNMEQEQQHSASRQASSTAAPAPSSSQCIVMAASSLLPNAATTVEPPNVERSGVRGSSRAHSSGGAATSMTSSSLMTSSSSMTSSVSNPPVWPPRIGSGVDRHAEALRRMDEYLNARRTQRDNGSGFAAIFPRHRSFDHPYAPPTAPSSNRMKFHPSSPPPQSGRQSTVALPSSDSPSSSSNPETPTYSNNNAPSYNNNYQNGKSPSSDRPTSSGYCSPTSKSPMSVYVLDFSYVLTAKTVSWSVLDENWEAPQDTILYSLVKGCGELILFGGMRSQATQDGQHGLDVNPFSRAITNETYILRPPIKF